MSLHPITGIISGTISGTQNTTSYTFMVTNSGGNTTVTKVITINDPPISISYIIPPTMQTRSIINISPTGYLGTQTKIYSISPPFSNNGLTFNTTNGIISGTLSGANNTTTTYTVSLKDSNSVIQVSTNFIIVIKDPPSGFSYDTPVTISKNNFSTISPVFTYRGTQALTYTINTPLPTGLGFDTNTGIISGTPSNIQESTSYSITLNNNGGLTLTTTLNIIIN